MRVVVDDLGRIVLKKKLREKYGKQFILIDRDEEIVLRPIKPDMGDLDEKLKKYSISKLRKLAEEEAMKEAGEVIK
jgi:bifunctional DNA-binding transcriptional regulator/antitoxin component of YhaV-PrlF toxin-antitoxin module